MNRFIKNEESKRRGAGCVVNPPPHSKTFLCIRCIAGAPWGLQPLPQTGPYLPLSPCALQAAGGGSQSGSVSEQTDGGTGSWRGMLKKGDDGMAGDRAVPQTPLPASPQRGHAVNLLDVVSSLP